MSLKNVDNIIVKEENKKLGLDLPKEVSPTIEPEIKVEIKSETPVDATVTGEVKAAEATTTEPEVIEAKNETIPEAEKEKKEKIEEKAESGDETVDAYGNEVPKKKLYTDEEVQRMIKERLARGQAAKQPEEQKEIVEAAESFEVDPQNTEGWEVQLEQFIEKTNEKLAQKREAKELRKKDDQLQAEFEVKFSAGMMKYSDFNSVVGGKPLSNAMMIATRSMDDPAAFIYAACKQSPKELERIASIKDPSAQMVEMGRLEERMKKARAITKAPAPPKKVSGDVSDKMEQEGIDERIAQHAKSKYQRIKG